MAKRNVHFFRANIGLALSGAPVLVDFRPALAHIETLDFTPEGRYLVDGDENVLCGWPHAGGPNAMRMALGVVRRNELPDVERRGTLTPLEIPPESGIVEQTYFVFFPRNIVGMLFNYHGPRITKLSWYMRRMFPGAPTNLRFDPLIRQDILDHIDHFAGIRILKMSLRRSFADRLAQANAGLFAGVEATLAASEAEEMGFELKPRRRGRSFLSPTLNGVVRFLARQPDLQEEVTKFEIQGSDENGDLEWVNILKERFVIGKEVEVTRGRRAVVPASAYAAIESAYGELREQLERAAVIW